MSSAEGLVVGFGLAGFPKTQTKWVFFEESTYKMTIFSVWMKWELYNGSIRKKQRCDLRMNGIKNPWASHGIEAGCFCCWIGFRSLNA